MGKKKNSFVDKIRESITRFGLIEKGDRVLLALSGGPDSVALLYGLLALKQEYDLKFYAAHLNHKLRGSESDEDERFARELVSHLGLKFFSKRVDVKKEAKKRKLSIEETAREVRYRYLERLADQIGANKIALGHQADDQAETFLMRLVRGAGAAGLSGMPARRGKIIRPLIQTKREEIEKYLKTNKIPFRLDSSNLLTNHYRNKIRLLLLPRIKKEFNPRIIESLNRAADVISHQQEHVRNKSERILKKISRKRSGKIVVDAKRFAGYDICLQREMIRLCVSGLSGDINRLSFELVDRSLALINQKKSGRRIKLVKEIWFETSESDLAIYRKQERKPKYTVKVPGKSNLRDWNLKIESRISSCESKRWNRPNQNRNVAFFDWDKLKLPLVLRSRQRGDRFKPLGMKGTKSVADLLIDNKVPLHLREEVPILTSKDRIAWVVGHRIGDEFKITNKTQKVLRLKITTSISE